MKSKKKKNVPREQILLQQQMASVKDINGKKLYEYPFTQCVEYTEMNDHSKYTHLIS